MTSPHAMRGEIESGDRPWETRRAVTISCMHAPGLTINSTGQTRWGAFLIIVTIASLDRVQAQPDGKCQLRRIPMMKKLPSLTLLTCLSLFVSQAMAQEHYTEGPVSRVILLRVKPGKMNDFWMNMRENTKPLFEEYKKQGVISDYRIFL